MNAALWQSLPALCDWVLSRELVYIGPRLTAQER